MQGRVDDGQVRTLGQLIEVLAAHSGAGFCSSFGGRGLRGCPGLHKGSVRGVEHAWR